MIRRLQPRECGDRHDNVRFGAPPVEPERPSMIIENEKEPEPQQEWRLYSSTIPWRLYAIYVQTSRVKARPRAWHWSVARD